MRKQRREDRGLQDMLGRMRRVSVHAALGIPHFPGCALVRAASRAENAIRDVMGAMVTPHELPPNRHQEIAGR
jgi:hypothetical protein